MNKHYRSLARPILLACLSVTLLAVPCPAQSLRLHWSEDGQRAWFRAENADGQTEFSIVDIASRSREPAFDHQRLAVAIGEVLGTSVDAAALPIDQITFQESPDQLLLKIRNKNWRLDRQSYELTETETLPSETEETELFLPPRPSGGGGESTHISVENRLESPIELIWISSDNSERPYATISPNQTHRQHTFIGHAWLLRSNGRPLGSFVAEADQRITIDEQTLANVRQDQPRRRWQRGGGQRNGRRNDERESPNGSWTAFVRDHNLWLRDGDDEKQLSTDGTPDNSYGQDGSDAADVRWSPDGKYLLAFQTTVVPERKVFYIESTPGDQLQPKLQSYDYRKPGDELPKPTVHLFAIDEMVEVPVSQELFANPWSLQFRGWSESGNRFTLHYNQRGHQTIRVLEVNANDGHVRAIIDENSDTFLQYSDGGKSVFEELNDDEILWASERSGWNHLYRYSRSSGDVVNAVTTGDWNVKRIEKIDREQGRIWFYAVGVYADQDPYHEHFCRVNTDGSDFRILTDGDGTHRIQFERNDQYFVDTYSRVDLAPISELRESESGDVVCELNRDDAERQFNDRRMTERFVAKGRDGSTDIWGIIHWPRDFDPNQQYPVVECIYAGPHDHHVPKSFRANFGSQHQIADQGMIVVQIDGMGTAWRSKAFHDVCHKNLRDAGFPDRIAWIKAAAEKHPQLDLSRVGIYGGSAGGQNAMAALLWHHDFYHVAVADCGCHDNRMDKIWWNEQWMGWPVDESYVANSNTEHAHLLEGHLMLLVGELDQNVDPASTTQVVRRLIEHNKDFEFVLVAGAGHGSAETPWGSRKRLEFLKKHLLSERSAD